MCLAYEVCPICAFPVMPKRVLKDLTYFLVPDVWFPPLLSISEYSSWIFFSIHNFLLCFCVWKSMQPRPAITSFVIQTMFQCMQFLC